VKDFMRELYPEFVDEEGQRREREFSIEFINVDVAHRVRDLRADQVSGMWWCADR
jgi:hypothetical protein